MNDYNYRAGLVSVTWADVAVGEFVWTDNYEGGRFPKANPLISGPYQVVSVADRRLSGRRGEFMHYPDNLLRKEG